MTNLILILPLMSWIYGQVIPEPLSGLKLPKSHFSFKLPRNDSSFSSYETSRQKARTLERSAPEIPIRDCNPCDNVPWVPMARSLHMPQYALSIPAIQLTLPVNYDVPVISFRESTQQNKDPRQHISHVSPQGLSLQYGPSHQTLYQNHIPSQIDTSVPINKEKTPQQNKFIPIDDEQQGLPSAPLPENLLPPTYGPPQSQTQLASPGNVKPLQASYNPLHVSPLLNHRLLSSVKFESLFDQRLLSHKPLLNNHLQTNHINLTTPPNSTRLLNQQKRHEINIKPKFFYGPIPFPTMSKIQLPPLFRYNTFKGDKNNSMLTFLKPPKPQYDVLTTTETEDNCKKCQNQSQLKDSEPAQTEQVTEQVFKSTEQVLKRLEDQFNGVRGQTHKTSVQDNSDVQVVKSVPIAEYLSSVEYPIQIIQAPILDVPDVSKYFNLGYHKFPQVTNFQENYFKLDQKTSHSFDKNFLHIPNFLRYNFPVSSAASPDKTANQSDLKKANMLVNQGTNSIPPNHKLHDITITDHQTTEQQPYHKIPILKISTTKPRQIFHIIKSTPSPQVEMKKIKTTALPSSEFVAPQPIVEHESILTNPAVQFSSKDYLSTSTTKSELSSKTTSNKFSNDYGGAKNVTDSRGWENTPQPLVITTVPSQIARFSIRPSSGTSKKSKHIHQIIVPYTINKQAVQEPASTQKVTTVPSNSQGRKVPPTFVQRDQLTSTTELDKLNKFQNEFLHENFPFGPNVALTSSGLDNLQHPIPPTSKGQPLNLSPQMINNFLQISHQGRLGPTGTEGLQQLLATNLQNLFRGEDNLFNTAQLQNNIDNWTAEGYKQNAPSVNFIPMTALSHIFNSKTIPREYLTSSVPPVNLTQSHFPQKNDVQSDHKDATSHKLQVKFQPLPNYKDDERQEGIEDSINGFLNNWPLLESKVTRTTPLSKISIIPETTELQPTSKTWNKMQVSISPLTNEKIYVVTPMAVTATEPEIEKTTTNTITH